MLICPLLMRYHVFSTQQSALISSYMHIVIPAQNRELLWCLPMREYYVLTQHPHAQQVFEWIWANHLQYEIHLNRVRFWVPVDSSLNTYFQLGLAESCGCVDPTLDTISGQPTQTQ